MNDGIPAAELQEWEDEGGSLRHPETPPTKPPAPQQPPGRASDAAPYVR